MSTAAAIRLVLAAAVFFMKPLWLCVPPFFVGRAAIKHNRRSSLAENSAAAFISCFRNFLCRAPAEKPNEKSFDDDFSGEWLENPVAYGAFENETLIEYAEGSLESWNNRFRISNLCVFHSATEPALFWMRRRPPKHE